MKVLIFTKIPRRQGFIGPIDEKITLDEVEVNGSIDTELLDGLHVPLDGECFVVAEEHVLRLTSRIVNEVHYQGKEHQT